MAMMDREKVISELDTQIRWIEDIDAHKFPGWCGATMAMRYAMMLLKEQQEQIDHLLEESASNAEMAEGLKELLKEDISKTETTTIVRCKDCLYWQDNNDGYPHIGCKWREDETPDPYDFCSAGERREE